jgi:serpin B
MSTSARTRRTVVTAQLACAALLAPVLVAGCSSSGGGAARQPASHPATSTRSAAHGGTGAARTVDRIGAAYELRAPDATGAPPAQANPSELAKGEASFAVALLQQASNGTGNVTVSPASLALALSMLQQGARGQTAAQIAKALRVSGMSASQQAAAWHALDSAWAAAANSDGFTLDTANSLWQQKGMTIGPDFLQTLSKYYDAGVWQVDFANDPASAVDAINKWTSQNTHGKIAKLFDSLDPATRLVIANAVYFKAAWASPFEGSSTHAGPFTLADNSTTSVPFMHGQFNYPAAVTSDYSAVELPYKGDRFSALAIMPNKSSLADFTSGMSGDRLATIVNGMHSGSVELSMPKFETTSMTDLGPILAHMGMRDAFSDNADLSGIGPNLTVSQVIQRTYLRVAEKGTVAAAATGVGITGTAIPAGRITIDLDHPFLFLIRDNTTGAILFASQIQDPQQS